MPGIIISCAGDAEFAKEVHDHFYSGLEDQQKCDKAETYESTEMISLADDKIHVDGRSLVPNGMIKWILESLLKSDPERFKEYGIFEFGDTFTIGVVLQPGRFGGLHICEFCGYFTPYAEELYTHRMTHYGCG